MDSYCTTHVKIPRRVILSGAAQRCNGERGNYQLPRSRTPKGRQQAESRHSCKVIIMAVSKYLSPKQNDTWVVPYNVTSLTDCALFRGAIRRERPAFHPSFRPSTNLNHFYPVAGAKRKLSQSRWTGLGAGAAGIRSTNMATSKSVPRKNRAQNPIGLKFLKVLKTSSKKFSSRVWDSVPRSCP